MTALALLRRAVEALRRTDPTAGADAADVVEALANGAPPAALGLCTPKCTATAPLSGRPTRPGAPLDR